jgi:hypothetical protein
LITNTTPACALVIPEAFYAHHLDFQTMSEIVTPDQIVEAREYDQKREEARRAAFQNLGYKEEYWPIWRDAWCASDRFRQELEDARFPTDDYRSGYADGYADCIKQPPRAFKLIANEDA